MYVNDPSRQAAIGFFEQVCSVISLVSCAANQGQHEFHSIGVRLRRSVGDYIDASAMFVVGDSPLAEIPNPFLEYLQ